MKKLSLLSLAVSAALLCTACGRASSSESTASPEAYSRVVFAMDTYMSIKTYGGGNAALNAAEERITGLEKELSVTDSGSDIARLNSADGKPVEVCEDTLAIIKKAVETGDLTGGALDVTAYPVVREWGFTTGEYKIPAQEKLGELLANVDYKRISVNGSSVTLGEGQELDLGALAKGYTGDEVVKTLRENGAVAGIISLGGNVQSFGERPDGGPWRVAVIDPFFPDKDMCIVEIGEKAVITSGNYERYFTGDDGKTYWHIIDPADGCPADNGIVSATIIGDVGLECDALSTAMFVAGTEKAVEIWRSDPHYDMILVTDDSKIFYTEGIAESFRNTSSMPAEVIALD